MLLSGTSGVAHVSESQDTGKGGLVESSASGKSLAPASPDKHLIARGHSLTPSLRHAMRTDLSKGVIYALLFCLSGLLALLAIGIVFSAPPELVATPHPAYPSMLVSGSAAPGGSWTLRAGYLSGVLVLGVLIAFVFIGVPPKSKLGWRLMAASSALYMATFIALLVTDATYATDGFTGTIFGFPPPTAWMIHGMWHMPWLMVLVYVVFWDSVSYTPEAEARFDALMETNRSEH